MKKALHPTPVFVTITPFPAVAHSVPVTAPPPKICDGPVTINPTFTASINVVNAIALDMTDTVPLVSESCDPDPEATNAMTALPVMISPGDVPLRALNTTFPLAA